MNEHLQSAEQFFAQRGFSQKIGFGAAPALIVIDLINGFTNPNLPLGAPLGPQLEATNQMLQVCRAQQTPVFFTTVSYDEANLEDAGIWYLKMKGLSTLRVNTPEVDIDPILNRQPDEPIIPKKYASAFFGTDLLSRLIAKKVDTLMITGCTTSGCVRATAVDAVQYGLRPIVVEEAVGDRLKTAHEQSLFDLNAKYADVVSVNEAIAYLRHHSN